MNWSLNGSNSVIIGVPVGRLKGEGKVEESATRESQLQRFGCESSDHFRSDKM